jgi:CHASE2 domain-containing sensor protein
MIADAATASGRVRMRRKSARVMATGTGLIVLAIAFFLFFLSIASKSNDPAGLMQTVGTVSGVGIGIGAVMFLFGWVGKET